MLYNPLYILYVKQDYKYHIYKQNSRPYFRSIYLKYCLDSKSYKKVYTNSILIIVSANIYIKQFIKTKASYTLA